MAPRRRRDGSNEQREGAAGAPPDESGRPAWEGVGAEPDELPAPQIWGSHYGEAPPTGGDLGEEGYGADELGPGWGPGDEDVEAGYDYGAAGPYSTPEGGAELGYEGSYPGDLATNVLDGEVGAPLTRRPRRRRANSGPWPELVMLTAVAVMVAAVALAVQSANRSKPVSGPTASPPLAGSTSASSPGTDRSGATRGQKASTSASSGSRSASSPTRSVASTTRPTTTTTLHALAKNLVISAAEKRSLVATWLATDPDGLGLRANDVSGTVPGEVYYGYDGAISTYFAVAAFQPSPSLLRRAKSSSAGRAQLAAFQDNEYVFSLQNGSTWTLLGAMSTGDCPGEWVPRPVLAVWGMCGLKP